MTHGFSLPFNSYIQSIVLRLVFNLPPIQRHFPFSIVFYQTRQQVVFYYLFCCLTLRPVVVCPKSLWYGLWDYLNSGVAFSFLQTLFTNIIGKQGLRSPLIPKFNFSICPLKSNLTIYIEFIG